MRGSWRGAWLLSVLMLLVACTSATPADRPSVVDVAAVKSARAAFAGPGQALGTAVRSAIVAARSARLDPPASSPEGAPAVAARAFTLDEYERLLGEVTSASVEVELDAEVLADANVAEAAAQWSSALRAAQRLVVAGRAELAVLRDLLDAEATLAGLAALWDEPGSRSQQTDRLTEAGGQAEDVVTMLSTLAEVPVCSMAVQRRRDAASLVAERTFELAGFVRNGQGRAFDEARASYDEEPWHRGIPTDDGDEADCWQNSSAVAASAAEVEIAIGLLADALNPATGLPGSGGAGG